MVVKNSPQWDYQFQSCVIRLIHCQYPQFELHGIEIFWWYCGNYFTGIEFQSLPSHIIHCNLQEGM